MRWFPGWLALAAVGCAWEAPLLDTELAPHLLNSISGTVVFVGEGELAPTFITVYDARNPGPPLGTGSPISFSAIAAEEWSDGTELPAVPYGVSRLPDGEYYVNALMDVDGDFNPRDGTLAGATCGDWVGSHISDLDARVPEPVLLQREDGTERGVRLEDVTLLLGQPIAVERPVFQLVDSPTVSIADLPLVPPYGLPTTLTLRATAVDVEIVNLDGEADPERANLVQLGDACAPDPKLDGAPIEQLGWRPCDVADIAPVGGLPQCRTQILAELVDADLDGLLDISTDPALAAAGIPEIWPRVYLQHIPEAPIPYVIDGKTYVERWVTQAVPMLLQIQGAAAYKLPPDAIAPVGQPLFANELSVTLLPVFVHYHEAGQLDSDDGNGPFDVVNLLYGPEVTPPTGAWGMTVITRTGQTWTVPNSLGVGPLPVLPGLIDSQAGVVVFQP